jgi:hypothetical protein
MRSAIRSEVIDVITHNGHLHVPVDVPYEVCDRDGFACFGQAGENARVLAIQTAVECGLKDCTGGSDG